MIKAQTSFSPNHGEVNVKTIEISDSFQFNIGPVSVTAKATQSGGKECLTYQFSNLNQNYSYNEDSTFDSEVPLGSDYSLFAAKND